MFLGLPTVPIGRTILTGDATSVTCTVDTSGITAWTPRHLVIHVRAKEDGDNGAGLGIRFNGDTGSNYDSDWVACGAASIAAAEDAGGTEIYIGKTQPTNFVHSMIFVPDAFSTRTNSGAIFLTSVPEESDSDGLIVNGVGEWNDTDALTSVTVLDLGGNNLDTGSYIELMVVDESYQVHESILTSDTDAGTGGNFNKSSISAGNGYLSVVGNIRTARADVGDSIEFLINGDTTTGNYWMSAIEWGGTFEGGFQGQVFRSGTGTGANARVGSYGPNVILIPNYSDGSKDRSYLSMSSKGVSGGMHGNMRHLSTTAVSQVSFTNSNVEDFLAGSMMSVYQVPATGGKLIERFAATTTTQYHDFDDIPDTYDHLMFVLYQRTNRGGWSSMAVGDNYFVIEDDTTDANYAWRRFRYLAISGIGNLGLTSGGGYTGGNDMASTASNSHTDTDAFCPSILVLFDYKSTDVWKHWLEMSGSTETSSDLLQRTAHGAWKSNSAIDEIKAYGAYHLYSEGFVDDSVVELYGINSISETTTFVPTVIMF